MKKTLNLLAAAACGAMASATGALAEYPEKPVEFIVPWPPGDLEDVLTRMIADEFQATYGVPAAVVNKPGGGGGPFPGAVSVANSEADGYTIGSFVLDVPIIGPHIGIPDLKEDTFEPLGIFLTYPFVLAAAKDAPFQTMEEMTEHAKENGLIVGHFGAGASPTEVTLAAQAVFDFEWGADSAFDALDCNTLASGDADVINTTLQLVLPCLDKINALAAYTEERISLLPDVPTLGELKPELELGSWNGLFVPKGTPQEAKDKIIAVAQKVMASPEAQELTKQTGALIYWQDAETAVARIQSDGATLANISELNGN